MLITYMYSKSFFTLYHVACIFISQDIACSQCSITIKYFFILHMCYTNVTSFNINMWCQALLFGNTEFHVQIRYLFFFLWFSSCDRKNSTLIVRYMKLAKDSLYNSLTYFIKLYNNYMTNVLLSHDSYLVYFFL